MKIKKYLIILMAFTALNAYSQALSLDNVKEHIEEHTTYYYEDNEGKSEAAVIYENEELAVAGVYAADEQDEVAAIAVIHEKDND